MITITVPPSDGIETYNESTNEFYYIDPFAGGVLQLEHSLISVRKWESKWHIPFLEEEPKKTSEQIMDYIRCMTLNHIKDEAIYKHLSMDNVNQILDYIKDQATATWFSKQTLNKAGITMGRNEKVTAELIYYWMFSYGIPVELEKWHINQLMTLIRVFSVKGGPQNKKDPKTAAMERAALNAQRRAKHHTRG